MAQQPTEQGAFGQEGNAVNASTNAQTASSGGSVAKLGFARGLVVQEFGYDDDVDDDLRIAVEDVTGNQLEDVDYGGVADAVIQWWRDGDGDLIDEVVDALTNLADGGIVVLLTPKSGRPGYVDASEIEEAARTCGMHASGSVNASEDWNGTRLVAPKTGRR